MGWKLAELFVELKADDKPLDADLKKARQSLVSFVGGAKGILAGLGVGLGAAGIARGLYSAATAAADLGESVSKTKFTFGSAFGTVNKTVEELADRFGIVRQTALDAASNIGLVTQAAGLSQQASAGLSAQLTKLAADAASFYNVPMADALDRIRSGLVGEAEPMRRFGVLLNEDAVKAEALRMGLVKSTKEVDDQAKVAARASLIIKGMSAATGDLERTQGSAANQLRKFQGQLENFKVDFGKALTGPLTDAIKLADELLVATGKLTGHNASSGGAAAGDFLGGLFGGLRGVNAAGVAGMETARGNNPRGLGSYFAPVAGYLAGAVKQAFLPSQNLADKLAGVEKGPLNAPPKPPSPREAQEAAFLEMVRRNARNARDVGDFTKKQDQATAVRALKDLLGAALTGGLPTGGAAGTLLSGAKGFARGLTQNTDLGSGNLREFRPEYFEGGRDYSRRIQEAAFTRKDQASREQIARNTHDAVVELQSILAAVKGAAKAKLGAVFQ